MQQLHVEARRFKIPEAPRILLHSSAAATVIPWLSFSLYIHLLSLSINNNNNNWFIIIMIVQFHCLSSLKALSFLINSYYLLLLLG